MSQAVATLARYASVLSHARRRDDRLEPADDAAGAAATIASASRRVKSIDTSNLAQSEPESAGAYRQRPFTSIAAPLGHAATTQRADAYMKVFNSPATAEAMAGDGVKRETVQMFVLDKALPI